MMIRTAGIRGKEKRRGGAIRGSSGSGWADGPFVRWLIAIRKKEN
jgi:hypothetical protein